MSQRLLRNLCFFSLLFDVCGCSGNALDGIIMTGWNLEAPGLHTVLSSCPFLLSGVSSEIPNSVRFAAGKETCLSNCQRCWNSCFSADEELLPCSCPPRFLCLSILPHFMTVFLWVEQKKGFYRQRRAAESRNKNQKWIRVSCEAENRKEIG